MASIGEPSIRRSPHTDRPGAFGTMIHPEPAAVTEAVMRIGPIFPQLEIGADPSLIRDYAQAVECMGYDQILVAC